jgi:hypothetical protein
MKLNFIDKFSTAKENYFYVFGDVSPRVKKYQNNPKDLKKQK